MSQYSAEKGLAWFYPIVIGCSVICCITSAVAWNHWKYVLDACPVETSCGCFLYAKSTYEYFEGGHLAYCHFATYGLILPLIFSIILGIYHVYRVCMGTAKRHAATTTIRQRQGDMIVVTSQSEMSRYAISPHYWVPAAVISCVMAFYTLVYASIYTDGFEHSCRQYRDNLLKQIQGVGNIVPVIKGRLSCAAIFDFMDYLLESYSYERRRYGRINSAACYYMALVGSWMAVFGWIGISIINIVQARRTKSARV